MSKLDTIMTAKQQTVLKQFERDDWYLMINYGAVRSGKTFVDNHGFLMELIRARKVADEEHINHPMYILAGVSSKSIQNNILQELTNFFGIEFKFDRHSRFTLFGVTVVQSFTGSISGLGAIRGMTATGAYINEASLANEAVFNEILDRCSVRGARIVCDTNPDNPGHWLYVNYILPNKPDIICNHFRLDDNTFLPQSYVLHKKSVTPKGVFYDRDIEGLWTAGQGAIYSDFDPDKHYITADQVPHNLSYYAGVDWGFEHKGVIGVFGDDNNGNSYLIEEHDAKHKQIDDYWIPLANKMRQRYGSHIPFYVDSARIDAYDLFQRAGINTIMASKRVIPGIEHMAQLITDNKLKVVKANTDSFDEEIYQYQWDEKNEAEDKPLKKNDDVMDMTRYALYTHHKAKTVVRTYRY